MDESKLITFVYLGVGGFLIIVWLLSTLIRRIFFRNTQEQLQLTKEDVDDDFVRSRNEAFIYRVLGYLIISTFILSLFVTYLLSVDTVNSLMMKDLNVSYYSLKYKLNPIYAFGFGILALAQISFFYKICFGFIGLVSLYYGYSQRKTAVSKREKWFKQNNIAISKIPLSKDKYNIPWRIPVHRKLSLQASIFLGIIIMFSLTILVFTSLYK
jgi:hypothetical protein